jgi:hypothetical protein
MSDVTTTTPAETLTAPGRDWWLSGEVADMLNIDYWLLASWIKRRRIPMPARDSAGRYLWTRREIEAARQLIGTDRRYRSGRRPTEPAAVAEAVPA